MSGIACGAAVGSIENRIILGNPVHIPNCLYDIGIIHRDNIYSASCSMTILEVFTVVMVMVLGTTAARQQPII